MEARLVYTSPEAVALGPSDLGTRARAFQPPKHKPTHILTPPPLFGMFLITLERRFPWSKDSLILALIVVRDWLGSKPNC